MLKAIIYDKDGTLMRFDAFWVPVARAAIKKVVEKASDGYAVSVGDICREIEYSIGVRGEETDPKGILCGGTYSQFAGEVTHALNEAGVSAFVGRREIESAVKESVSEGKILPTCDNLRLKLAEAKKHAKLFVATTDDYSITEICLKRLGVFDLFDKIYCDDGRFPHKPDPAAANEIATALNADKNEIFMAGDTSTDEKFALAAGINFVFVGKDGAICDKTAYRAKNAGDATDLIMRVTRESADFISRNAPLAAVCSQPLAANEI